MNRIIKNVGAGLALFVAGNTAAPALAAPPTAAQLRQQQLEQQKQQQIQALRSDLARVRTQISVTDSNYRTALVGVAQALSEVDRRDNVNAAVKGSKVLAYLGPVGRVLKGGVSAAVGATKAYDVVVASLSAGRLTNTRRELEALRLQIDNSRLNEIAPMLRKQVEIVGKLKALGVANP